MNNDAPQTKEGIIREKYPNLIGQPITLTEAAEKYDVPRGTIENWVNRTKYLDYMDTNNYPYTIDEAEIAYLADIYQQRKASGSKAPLLDENGLPYVLKHPGLAEYRKKKKR